MKVLPARGSAAIATTSRARTVVAVAAVAACVALALGCTATTSTATSSGTNPTSSAPGGTGPGAPGSTAPAPKPPYALTTTTLTFVDHSRPTEAGSKTPALPARTLETVVRVPDVPGTFPLIVFSHGLFGHPDKFTKLLDRWASAGFVVAAPAFPLTNDKVPGATANWTGLAEQPADVRFVIDEMLRLDADPASAVHGRLQRDQIGVGGLSLGGATTYGVAFNECCADPRIKSVEVLAGAQLPVGGGHDDVLDGHVPLLMIHGDADLSLPYQMEVDGFAKARGPVWFVTFIGAPHAPPFEDDPTRWDATAEQITTDFWLGTLGAGHGDPAALARVDADATVEGLSSIQKK